MSKSTKKVRDYAIGDNIYGPTRPLTMERIAWYSIGMLSGAMGSRQPVQHNIHTDDEYARSQGLPAAIADGMHSTNWLSSMMADHFGAHYVAHGELRTKFIKPTYANIPITTRGVITSRSDEGNGNIKLELDVWCEDNEGNKLTVGDAAVLITSELGDY
ncbi:MAG: MaoC family dehydratase [Candidatus Nanopelagicaceae bacterium]